MAVLPQMVSIPLTLPGRLLLLDDDLLVSQSLSALFKAVGGYDIKSFNQPQQALDNLDAFHPEVVISDFLMPGMNGIEFLQQVRQHSPDSSLLLLTGYADKQSAIQAINDVGLTYFLEKPWDNAVLLLAVSRALEQARLKTGLERANQALVHAQELSRLREDFVSTLTHDLRTPLLACIQTLTLISKGCLGPLTPQQIDILTMLTDSQTDLLGMVNSLLEVYRFESGKHRLLFSHLDISQLFRRVIDPLRILAEQKQLILILSIPDELPSLWVDSMALQRVLTNLVANAIEHTPPGGHVELSAHRLSNSDVELAVSDTGRGIPPDDQLVLFQRFSQGTSQLRKSGSGLGLYLARQIVEAHQGQIGLQSEVGQGSRFFIRLPAKTGLPASDLSLTHH